MNLKSTLFIAFAACLLTNMAEASGKVDHYADPLKKTFIENPKKLPDMSYQVQLRQQPFWQKFATESGSWSVIFDESSGMPHRAFGNPLAVSGASAREVAMTFMNVQLRDFNIPVAALQYDSEATSSKYKYVNFRQQYQGLDVLFSKVQIKMTHDYRVMQFGLDCYNNITISTQAALSESSAIQAAVNGVGGVMSVQVTPELKVLPVPQFRKYNYRLVYEVMVNNMDGEGIPGKYYTLVDANNGEVLYRSNKVHHIANTDVNVTGTLYLTHPYDPSTVEPLKNMKITEGGNTYYTDDTGYLGLANTNPSTATFALEGLYVSVRTNNATPSWSVSLNPGANAINIDGNTDIKQRTTYTAINTVHGYMKSKYPAFTGLDFDLPANVDVAGSCNAFYDGSSVNFFAAGGGCNATSLVADVCYHEYGHGINDKFYQSVGSSFDNGAMGEGYADLWALGITGSPILGIGFFSNDPNGFVRRYDIDKKVYPQDLVGEVHADGEIIAGAFWDTHLNLGNLQQMMDLFKETFYAGITGPDGTEGTLFTDVLLETLTVDDNDGNLSNGTPNYCAISSGFAIHGISLSAAGGLNHTSVLSATGLSPITVDASVQNLGVNNIVKGYYRVGNSGSFSLFSFANTGGNNFQGTIPAQPNGTIVEYYLGIEDDCGTFLNVTPAGADDAVNPNIPYYILVGYDELLSEDFDNTFGAWIIGLPTDNNTTGTWLVDVPIPSFVGTALVQPDIQNTPGGIFCAITGNAANASSAAGDNDVDGGATSIVSPDFDLSSYTNPAFTFYRWYSNDQGATPGTDFWQVSISGDGVNYVPVENTNVADHSWRRFAFRVQDYITPTATVSVKFVAEDANAGSLIEAALDDLVLWDEIPTGVSDAPDGLTTVSVFPNPAVNQMNVNVGLSQPETIRISVYNALGSLVYSDQKDMPAGNNLMGISAEKMAAGLYQVKVSTDSKSIIKKINVIR